jgi:exodeoxyribonuclease V alpha subunit
MYKGHCGVNNLNEQLQNKFNPDMGQLSVQIAKQTFRIGDRVMQTKNDYFLNVYNGDTGYITKIEGETADSRLVTIKYDDREVVYDMDQLHNIVLAYAITIHKSQGCEYPGIIIALLPEHYIMLQRNLFYTAVTRAKTACVVVGDEKSMSIAIANDKINKRFTALKWFLKTVNLNDGYFEELIEEESLEKKLKEKELEMDEIPF